VGYPFAKKGWKVYEVETVEIFVSRNIVFHEEQFPCSEKTKEDLCEGGKVDRAFDDDWSSKGVLTNRLEDTRILVPYNHGPIDGHPQSAVSLHEQESNL